MASAAGHVFLLAHLPHKVTTDLMPRLHMALLYTLAGLIATEGGTSSLEAMWSNRSNNWLLQAGLAIYTVQHKIISERRT